NHNLTLPLRQPPLAPTFPIKRAATAPPYPQLLPIQHINLHFNPHFHAITTPNNPLSPFIHNHLHQRNQFAIHQRRIQCKPVLHMNH
ncbi:formate--tetrahydrofolate ligase, partial [Staphylococcus epidermidis]|uniref:formate--tetrahydrofolate ligase n=1 Tax=Staphylococcus epidermidis TaxID=1282 RepID=UPI0011A61F3F